MTRRRGLRIRRRGWLNLAAIVLLLIAVNFVPHDTSLAEVRRTGLLRACVPTTYPPLITGRPDAPGFDVDVLQAVAGRLDLRLVLSVNAAIGKDFNPRNWQNSRAQCEVIAGGIVQSPTTSGFLQTLSTGITTGWVMVSREPLEIAEGQRFAVLPGSGRLDRIGLIAFLRDRGVGMTLAPNPAALADALASGQVDAAIAERFAGGELLDAHPDWHLQWLAPDRLPTYPLALGLWKGDTTLKRAIERQMEALESDGTMAELRGRNRMACPASAGPGTGPAC